MGAAGGHQGAWVTEGAMTGGPSLCLHGCHRRYERMSTERHVALNTRKAGHRAAGLTLARREGEPLSQDDNTTGAWSVVKVTGLGLARGGDIMGGSVGQGLRQLLWDGRGLDSIGWFSRNESSRTEGLPLLERQMA